jgi:hypothetical protein
MNPSRLHVHEWVAISAIMSLLMALTLLNFLRSDRAPPLTKAPPHFIVDQKIEVFVEGAVEKPGRLIVVKGKRVKEILDEVHLLPEADVSKLNLDAKARRGQRIRVPYQKLKKSKELLSQPG